MAEVLCGEGYEVTTAYAENIWFKVDDPTVFQWCINHGYVVVTYNIRDFQEIYNELFQNGTDHPGLIIIFDKATPSHDIGGIIRGLRQVLDSGIDLQNLQISLPKV